MGRHRRPGHRPPPNAPELTRLDPDLVDAFFCAFVDGHARPGSRPTAEEWSDVLAGAEARLVVCRSGHVFGGHARRCPECGQRRDRPAVADAMAAGPGGRAASRNGGTTAAGAARAAARGPAGGWIGRTLGAVGLGARPAQGGVAAAAAARSRPGAGGTANRPPPQGAAARGAGAAGTATRASPTAAVSTTPPHGAPTVLAAGAAGAWTAPAPPLEPTGSRRQRAVWAAGIAAGAVTLAIGARSVLAALVDPARAWIAGLAAVAGVPPAEVWAAGVGGLALAVVTLFRGAAHAPDWRLAGPLAERLARRTGAGVLGWAGGWWMTAAVAGAAGAALSGGAAPPVAGGTSAAPPATAGIDAAGWLLGWCLYGAVAGALGDWIDDTPAGRAGTGAVFGAVGWVGARVAGALAGV